MNTETCEQCGKDYPTSSIAESGLCKWCDDTTQYSCPKCKKKVSTHEVSDGYFRSCLVCDEDFYKFELTT